MDICIGLLIIALLLSIYLFPYIIARGRHLEFNRWSIFFLNLFLGWTLAGWVGALCWAVSGTASKRQSGCRKLLRSTIHWPTVPRNKQGGSDHVA